MNNDAHQKNIIRQASILRKNIQEWDYVLNNPARAENWPTMLGRLNAAFNQAGNMDEVIEDVLEHFVYLPKKVTANPGDIPLFMSSKLAPVSGMEVLDVSANEARKKSKMDHGQGKDLIEKLDRYEKSVEKLANHFEEAIVRY